MGLQHETIGSDVIAVLDVINLPELVLGKERADALKKIEASKWYPLSTLEDPVEGLHQRVGDASLLQIGSELLRISHAPAQISQRKCFRKGDDCCEYVITSFMKDERWTGDKKPAKSRPTAGDGPPLAAIRGYGGSSIAASAALRTSTSVSGDGCGSAISSGTSDTGAVTASTTNAITVPRTPSRSITSAHRATPREPPSCRSR